MKNMKLNLSNMLILLFGLFLTISLLTNDTIAQTKTSYKVIEIKNKITVGKDKEVNMLFEGDRRKIAQLTLRNGKRLESHSVKEPIVIQCVAGEGELIINNAEENNIIKLLPGTFVTIESNVMHDVIGKPEISILLIRFLQPENKTKNKD